jgi:predicted esterase
MSNPSLDLPTARVGAEEGAASLAAILVHGRWESPGHMIEIARRLAAPEVAYFALQAPGATWYPQSFLAPLEANQPQVDWALERIGAEVQALERRGWTRDRIALIGYSQGACLVSQFAWENPARWACVLAFTGGLIGPPGTDWGAGGDFGGTPVLLTNGDHEPWVPWPRVQETARRFETAGARVDLRLYPGREHLVLDDEIAAGRAILDQARDRAKVEA